MLLPRQTVVWFEEERVLFGGTTIYRAFPRIHHGNEHATDVREWIRSLDRMRALEAEALVLHHTRPVVGKENVFKALTAYRDALQLLHDQTVRFMNKGLNANEIIQQLDLPKQLLDDPFLQPYYGTIPWAVKDIYTFYMGWFSGDPTTLLPLPDVVKAKHMIKLAGGLQNMFRNAESSLKSGDCQWASELMHFVLTIYPKNQRARNLLVGSFRCLASVQLSAIARNYFLSSAKEIEDGSVGVLAEGNHEATIRRLSSAKEVFGYESFHPCPFSCIFTDQTITMH